MCVFKIAIEFILIMNSPIRQEASCFWRIKQSSDRFKVKFLSFGDWYYVRTVNIATFCPECYALTRIIDILKLRLKPIHK